MSSRIRGTWCPAALAAVLLAGPLALPAQDSARSPIRPRTMAEDLQMFSQVLNQIRVNHPDSVDVHALLIAAVDGMVHAADPHSFVIPAIRLDSAKDAAYRAGKLYPVPISFSYVEDAPVVVGVAPGSSAVASDILPGDELVGIDGKPVAAGSADELDVVLSGPKRSTVRLTFERRRADGSYVRFDRSVARERVEEATAVPTSFMLDSTTGYARITTFGADKAADDLHDALGKLEAQGMKRLVLDLRDNGGGRVDQATRIAGEFLPKGAIVYTADGRKQDVVDTGRVSRSFWRTEKSYPIVLLVNAGTASASELVAGALQDHDRAVIVGRPTFGKSLLMRGFPMTDGSIFMLVVGRMRTPCGRVIQREYHALRRGDYYRLATADRDTAGRPSCRTDNGRVVYGGGGIYPDVVLPIPATPVWLGRVGEQDLILKWVGGYVTSEASRLQSLDSLAAHHRLRPGATAEFRSLAASDGVVIPDDSTSDALLERVLVRFVARARFGESGYYRLGAVLDPAMRTALSAFERRP